MANDRYPDDKVADLIKSRLPKWAHDHGYLSRTYLTENWSRTTMLAAAIAYLGEKAWHHPELFLSHGALKVLLMTHESDGVTERDFVLAEEIERVATWLPDVKVFKNVEHWFD